MVAMFSAVEHHRDHQRRARRVQPHQAGDGRRAATPTSPVRDPRPDLLGAAADRRSGFRYGETGFTRQTIGGCGVWNSDANWARNTVVNTLNNTVRNAVAGMSNVPAARHGRRARRPQAVREHGRAARGEGRRELAERRARSTRPSGCTRSARSPRSSRPTSCRRTRTRTTGASSRCATASARPTTAARPERRDLLARHRAQRQGRAEHVTGRLELQRDGPIADRRRSPPRAEREGPHDPEPAAPESRCMARICRTRRARAAARGRDRRLRPRHPGLEAGQTWLDLRCLRTCDVRRAAPARPAALDAAARVGARLPLSRAGAAVGLVAAAESGPSGTLVVALRRTGSARAIASRVASALEAAVGTRPRESAFGDLGGVGDVGRGRRAGRVHARHRDAVALRDVARVQPAGRVHVHRRHSGPGARKSIRCAGRRRSSCSCGRGVQVHERSGTRGQHGCEHAAPCRESGACQRVHAAVLAGQHRRV